MAPAVVKVADVRSPSRPATSFKTLNDILRGLTPTDGPSPPSVDLDVAFEFDSARLTVEAREQLDELAGALKTEALRGRAIRIVGHTDASGSAGYNLKLSERRAAAVRDYLVSVRGIEGARLTAIGRGEAEPKNPVNPNSGINRRVEVISLATR